MQNVWQYGMKSHAPGELVRIDHAVIQLDSGATFRQFTAVDPLRNMHRSGLYSGHKQVSCRFLRTHEEHLPLQNKIHSSTTVEASLWHFETGLSAQNIELYVLPPKSPKLNGGVERGNGTAKDEFFIKYQGPPKLEFFVTA